DRADPAASLGSTATAQRSAADPIRLPIRTGVSHEGYLVRPGTGPPCSHDVTRRAAVCLARLTAAGTELGPRHAAAMAPAPPRTCRTRTARRPHAARYRHHARRCL